MFQQHRMGGMNHHFFDDSDTEYEEEYEAPAQQLGQPLGQQVGQIPNLLGNAQQPQVQGVKSIGKRRDHGQRINELIRGKGLDSVSLPGFTARRGRTMGGGRGGMMSDMDDYFDDDDDIMGGGGGRFGMFGKRRFDDMDDMSDFGDMSDDDSPQVTGRRKKKKKPKYNADQEWDTFSVRGIDGDVTFGINGASNGEKKPKKSPKASAHDDVDADFDPLAEDDDDDVAAGASARSAFRRGRGGGLSRLGRNRHLF
ncbi:hypothetical protein SYNPS1DRAFT_27676 [Syncephalis pseudoplumigaleata]|uniref:Uncharacterized protein n=1 Tax=Syncephalis pseudoplumigaleata TaxID=1712513 RepID=A0A4P9Z2A5_9FUNG|nr:hypothetical protein SYNPS1DRAFT_27676 [Syncephalis pseudoplumigaleata]|eukprot:RKP26643.1 hypothetical protein SYNPS1DRAFT_27676 [Syncephalis pseudoplumigaleata]